MQGLPFFQPSAGRSALDVHTLVIPLLGIGNVPQLALDLFVNTLALPRCGFVLHSSVLPLVAANVFSSSGELSTACEIFAKEGVAWMQLRSAFRKNGIESFCKALIEWVSAVGIKQVVILGSFDDAWLQRPDVERGGVKFFCGDAEWARVLQAELGFAPLQWTVDPAAVPSMRDTVIAPRTYADFLLRGLESAKLRSCMLMLFCSEGENVPEAQLLCNSLVAFFQKVGLGNSVARQSPSWIAPISWAHLLGQVDETTTRQLFQ
jgi:hypothetical protein